MPAQTIEAVTRAAHARETVQVRWVDGRIYEAPVGTTIGEFVRAIEAESGGSRRATDAPVVAAIADGRLRELSYALTRDADLAPVTMASEDGMRIYRRGLIFLMVAAAMELFPEAEVVVDHSIYSGGYFSKVRCRENFSPDELRRLAARMREMVEADLPITKEIMPLAQAVEMFRARGDGDKAKLLAMRRKDYLVVYRLGPLADYYHGYMVPSTGSLRWFDLKHAPPGFIVQFPQRGAPTSIQPLHQVDRLLTAFRDYGAWLDRLGIRDVGSLNEAVSSGRVRELVLVSEALHEQRLAQIASRLAAGQRDQRLVLIAGPSSSGKTTFSKRLAVQLLANGVRPFALAMDEYFVDRERTPRDENGELDYESLYALDLERLNDDLLGLMAGREVTLPHYDFKTGKSGTGETIRLPEDTLIVVEGIHGLDPDLVPHISQERIFRIYASALTQLNLDRHNRVSTTDTRLIRRIVRDAAARGYSAADTLRRWDSVRRGETLYIFPFQQNADVMFNSALVYELAVLRPLAEPLLLQVQPNTPEYVEAKRLLALLSWFQPCPANVVPDNSILREFTGGSILAHFKLWGMPT